MKNGIDISKHQGIVDWKKVTADFVIIRAGWSWYDGGMNIDTQFLANVTGAQAAGIPWGVYIYAYDKTPAAARIAANQLADLLDQYKIPYPVAYDYEDPQYFTMGKTANTAICKAFLETLQKRGYYAMLYTFTSFARNYLDMNELSAYDFWVADYTGKVGWPGEYGIWQHSGNGTAPGISTAVDLDIAYKDYPAIIQAAGLNGYGKNETGDGDNAEEGDISDSTAEEIARLFQELKQENATLRNENASLRVKIADAQAVLA